MGCCAKTSPGDSWPPQSGGQVDSGRSGNHEAGPHDCVDMYGLRS